MRDANLVLKAAGAETTSTTGSFVDFEGPDVQPLTYVVVVTAASGTSPTLDLTIEESADGSNALDSVKLKQITAAGVYRVTAKFPGAYRRYKSVFGGTNPSFTYSIYPELGGQYENF